MGTTKFKDFGAGTGADQDDISFMLYGQTFHCVPQMQGQTLIDFAVIANGADSGAQAAMVNKFFQATIIPGDYEKFNALCQAPETIVTVEVLVDIVTWIMEQYANRPKEDTVSS